MSASMMASCICRSILEPYASSSMWILAHILAFTGTFFVLLMSAAYDTNLGLTGGANKSQWKARLTASDTFAATLAATMPDSLS